MEPVILALEEKYEKDITFVIVDIDDPEGRRLASDFKIAYIPALFYIDTNGEIVAQDVGFMTKGELERRIILQLINDE